MPRPLTITTPGDRTSFPRPAGKYKSPFSARPGARYATSFTTVTPSSADATPANVSSTHAKASFMRPRL